MTTTTFGFDALQDRIWMRVHERDQTVWLTRRMVVVILGPMVQAFENATPGQQGGAAAPARAALEHELALHETAPGQAAPQIRAGRVPPSEDSDPQFRLCTGINARASNQSMAMTFATASGPLELQLSRKGMHLWLRGLAMVLKQAQWGMPQALPKWLDAGLMPPSIQALIDKPWPQDPEGG
ncbi:hypothetical protein LPB72_16270 [Hydrogenophaga crassostreae]|uniref:Uncharacterized protein n=1 Tax=Hydrogenophaga crassostreae TaxID=1763535 RepID=A0A163CA54_9BURK|nr:hypothetical protein [Hydrogenophaga crassostreae]AOW12593.1 hypothetical protein LPB072_06785 [Hydrogenophaga crassostreae]OAD40464.1 hypothetical protein LPB72_16270 [Hydrogenophaga crassostreae]